MHHPIPYKRVSLLCSRLLIIWVNCKKLLLANKHILVAMDHFIKWCEAFGTKDQKPKTVAIVLVSRLFSRFGPPTLIHSDQGQNFDSIIMHEVYNMMGPKKTYTTPYNPQCDRLVQQQNRICL